MSPGRRHSLMAISRHPKIHMLLTGPGWNDWDNGKTLSDNIARILPKADFLVWYKPQGGPGIEPILGYDRSPILTCARYNECWWEPWEEIAETTTGWVLCHQQSDVQAAKDHCPGVHVTHIPHCAEQSYFGRHLPHDERVHDCILTGVLSESIYPLRHRLAQAIRAGEIPGHIRKHPGYRLNPENWQDQVWGYASDLGKSRIALVTSSVYCLSLTKYIEAIMAGCLVIGDRPASMAADLMDYVVPIDPDAHIDQIGEVINHWVKDAAKREELARAGQATALQKYTQENYAEAFIRQAEELLNAC